MDDQHPSLTPNVDQAGEHFLQGAPLPEDWGGDGSSRMSLSGRCTVTSSVHEPGQYQFFNSHTVPAQAWRVPGMPTDVAPANRRLLTWHDCGASTSRVWLPPEFEAPSGMFTADLEIFVLRGKIQLGDWQLRKHGYSFIPAGVKIGPLKVLDSGGAEVIWMENGPIPLRYEMGQASHPNARISDFIPVVDSQLLPWGKTETVQFEVAKKKYLRRARNGGGVWLLAILPHYDGRHIQLQCYNEEAYCLAGYIDIGDYRFEKDHAAYCPSFNNVPRHHTTDGTLFFVRIDRDVSRVGTVLSYDPSLP
jgi:hypothetical protein